MTINYGAIIVLVAGFAISRASHWDYDHQDNWPGTCLTGDTQSPVDLTPRSADIHTYWPFAFSNYDGQHNATVTNNGHTVVINFLPSGENVIPKVSGGGLPDEYTLHEIHFHWKSEHTLQGYRFPLEMHIVHFATKYDSLENALRYDNGLAVLGVLFDLSIDDDEFFYPVVNAVKKVHRSIGKPVDIEVPLRMSSFLPRDHGGYFRYKGSLTTPKCTENVIWTVFSSTLPISEKQLLVLQDTQSFKPNYRELQPFNLRKRKLVRRIAIGTASLKLASVGVLVTNCLLLKAFK